MVNVGKYTSPMDPMGLNKCTSRQHTIEYIIDYEVVVPSCSWAPQAPSIDCRPKNGHGEMA